MCLLIASAVLANSASAQVSQTGNPKLSPLMLLYNKDVQKELNLSDDQIQKVNQEVKFQREARRNLREVTNEKERNEKVEALNQRCENTINGFLKSDQARRLQQIVYQAHGPQAMSRNEVVEKLKFTPDQRQKIKQIQETTFKQVQNTFQPGGNREEAMKKRTEIVNRAWDQLMRVMTAEQKERWKEMTGAPFQGQIPMGGGRTVKRST
jgi:hypothetical protein